ncbi:GGDEF domain-containing protein [Acidobacteria bacterium AB60]|nr:GGDEF domain-containing protein [Acidobacteria bacterium AB60]
MGGGGAVCHDESLGRPTAIQSPASVSGPTEFIEMYMPFMMGGYAAAVLLMLAGCRVVTWSVPGLRGVRFLTWGFGCGLAGVILMALRPFAPAWLTILLANLAIYAAQFLLYGAVADCLGAWPGFRRAGLALMTVALCGMAWFTYVDPDLTARILISSAVPGSCTAASAALLLRHLRKAPRGIGGSATRLPAMKALAGIQILLTVQHLLRCVLTLLYPPAQILHLDLIQAAYTYTNLILNVAGGCGLIWLALCIHREDLEARAETDGLTGLLNRRAFEEILTRELRRARVATTSLAILLTDIDRFKEVNDSLGHQAGDEVLRRVTRALRESLRPADVLSRFGGEEFAILLRDTNLGVAEEVAERLRLHVAGLTGLPSGLHITISIGVAANDVNERLEELVRRCDEALYRSKRAGRNLVTLSREYQTAAGMAPADAVPGLSLTS